MRALAGWLLMSLSVAAQGLTKMDLTCRVNEASPLAVLIEPASKPAIQADRGVTIHIIVRNVSDDDQTLEKTTAYFLFWPQITDSRGRKVEMTQKYMDLFHPSPPGVLVGSGVLVSLQPRAAIEDDWKISDYLDLSRPGRYTLTLVRHFYQQNVNVCSNTMNLLVK